jgi:oligopeptide/dipeptide ABC transporter ATP-binding protein
MLILDRVTKVYRVGTFGGGELLAVRDVSFGVSPGEVVSLIGESGSGKTTVGKMILRLTPVTTGAITLDGVDVSALTKGKLKSYYANVQGVFQDPFSSYNPIFRVDHVFNLLRNEYFGGLSGSDWARKLGGSVEAVGLDPAQVLRKYPHQLSGGQLQRLLVARALLLDIKYLVADEISSMLDASTRIDVLNLLGDLKERGLGIVFITHDLSLGNYISEKTVILRRGRIVEMGATGRVFGNPQHPYTKMLLASVPQLHRTWEEMAAELKAPVPALVTGTGSDDGAAEVDGGADTRDAPALVEVEEGHLVAPFSIEPAVRA